MFMQVNKNTSTKIESLRVRVYEIDLGKRKQEKTPRTMCTRDEKQ